MGENRPYESDQGPGHLPLEGGSSLTEHPLESPATPAFGSTRPYKAKGAAPVLEPTARVVGNSCRMGETRSR